MKIAITIITITMATITVLNAKGVIMDSVMYGALTIFGLAIGLYKFAKN